MTIPTLSLSDLDRDPDGFARAFGDSFRTYGFAVVADHGIDPALVQRGWDATAAFFALPEEVKRRYAGVRGGARGYTPFRTEVAKGATEKDLKEFWHVGRDLPAGHPFEASMPPNVWPAELPEFRAVFDELYAAFDRTGGRLLSAIARYLGLAPDWFEPAVRDGNSVLRLLHYPPVSPDAPGIRAEAHEDINLITLLLGAEEAGLEILRPDGGWLAVDVPPGAMAVNVGDMLQRLTNDYLPSTTHRVVNPPPERRGKSRYSMPFFHHLASDFEIRSLPQCVTPERPDRYQPISADDYLQERLREIGLL